MREYRLKFLKPSFFPTFFFKMQQTFRSSAQQLSHLRTFNLRFMFHRFFSADIVSEKPDNIWLRRNSPHARRAAKLSSCRSIIGLLNMLIFCVHLFRCVCSSYLCFLFSNTTEPGSASIFVFVWDVPWLLAIRPLSIFSFSHLFSASVHGPKTESSKTMMTNPWPCDSFST